MILQNKNIDAGKGFDFGKTSADYAKYRDIYPEIFYEKIVDRDLCINGQKVLDLGTGTGVLPRNMYRYGASWIGADISENQITQAKELARSSRMDIEFITAATEDISFPDNTFDVVTACQCLPYFNHEKVMPLISNILKGNGKLVILYMAWLPFEDKIAAASEELVLKYNPGWTGAKEIRRPVWLPDEAFGYFELEEQEQYDVMVPFTRESWHGRMRSCRGVGASLSASELENWDKEHRLLLNKIAPEEFEILHYAAIAVLKKL